MPVKNIKGHWTPWIAYPNLLLFPWTLLHQCPSLWYASSTTNLIISWLTYLDLLCGRVGHNMQEEFLSVLSNSKGSWVDIECLWAELWFGWVAEDEHYWSDAVECIIALSKYKAVVQQMASKFKFKPSLTLLPSPFHDFLICLTLKYYPKGVIVPIMSSLDMFWQLNIGLVNTLYNIPGSTGTVQYWTPHELSGLHLQFNTISWTSREWTVLGFCQLHFHGLSPIHLTERCENIQHYIIRYWIPREYYVRISYIHNSLKCLKYVMGIRDKGRSMYLWMR